VLEDIVCYDVCVECMYGCVVYIVYIYMLDGKPYI
jgi:hypothetical protein